MPPQKIVVEVRQVIATVNGDHCSMDCPYLVYHDMTELGVAYGDCRYLNRPVPALVRICKEVKNATLN